MCVRVLVRVGVCVGRGGGGVGGACVRACIRACECVHVQTHSGDNHEVQDIDPPPGNRPTHVLCPKSCKGCLFLLGLTINPGHPPLRRSAKWQLTVRLLGKKHLKSIVST